MHRGGHGFKNRAHQRMHFMSFCVERKACSCSYVRAIRQRPLIPQMQWVDAPHWPPSSRAQALAPIASQLMPRAFPEHQQIRRSICGCLLGPKVSFCALSTCLEHHQRGFECDWKKTAIQAGHTMHAAQRDRAAFLWEVIKIIDLILW